MESCPTHNYTQIKADSNAKRSRSSPLLWKSVSYQFMTIDMNDDHIMSISQLNEIVKFGRGVKFNSDNKKETYEWIGKSLGKFHYFGESKKNKGILKSYIIMMTGYSEGNVDRLIQRKKQTGRVFLKERTQNVFAKRYEAEDIVLLAETARTCQYPNGKAVKAMMCDMYQLYGDLRFEKLQHLSVSHFYNLRETNIYQSRMLDYTKTCPVKIAIGERRKPQPNGKPGFLRVDSVHQGDLDKKKGVYHINLVDEVTQWEVVGCVEGISEYFLSPLLEELIESFPFKILNFHSDNGSEYINYTVAKLLNKLSIEQTKSRSGKSQDNGLAEGKNNAVIRKQMGYIHIPKQHAKSINQFYKEYLNDYLGFHRHCAFSTDTIDEKGKIIKKYDTYLTPCQRLLSIPNVEQYLKKGVSRESLEKEMMEVSHLKVAEELQKEKSKLFKLFKEV